MLIRTKGVTPLSPAYVRVKDVEPQCVCLGVIDLSKPHLLRAAAQQGHAEPLDNSAVVR